eukprot:7140121-Karenia_brevis.AAC.1
MQTQNAWIFSSRDVVHMWAPTAMIVLRSSFSGTILELNAQSRGQTFAKIVTLSLALQQMPFPCL